MYTLVMRCRMHCKNPHHEQQDSTRTMHFLATASYRAEPQPGADRALPSRYQAFAGSTERTMTTGFELLPFLVPTAIAVVCFIALIIKGKK